MKSPLDMNGFPIQIVSIPPSNHIQHDLLLGLSKTDGSLAEVVDGVPLSEECITENCQWAYGLGEVLYRVSPGSLNGENF
jgi:hypothetical protein